MTEINIQYSDWYYLLCPAIGIIYAIFLYLKNNTLGEQKTWLAPVLGALRATAVALVVFLLLNPFIKSIFEDQKDPIVVILEDDSKSIYLSKNQDSIAIFDQQKEQLINALSESYEVKFHKFGSNIFDGVRDSLLKETSNLNAALSYVKDNYADQNLGAVILSTDGIYNEGKNPIYGNYNIKSPIYTIAHGDTTIRKDLWVKNIFHNQIAYLGDKISIQIDIQANNGISQQSNLSLGRIVNSKNINIKRSAIDINSNNFFKTINIEIDINEPGVNHYRVNLTPINGEALTDNNTKDFYIEVLDARQNILILANAPNPDIATIRTLLSENKNYEIELSYDQELKKDISSYDFVILHNLPSSSKPIDAIIKNIQDKKIPSLYVLGLQTDLNRFNKSQSVVQISSNQSVKNMVQAEVNAGFSLFTLSDGLKQNIKSYPPISSVFGEFSLGPKTYVALNQKIGDISTDYPLLAFSELSGIRTGVFTAEGMWRWKLYNYVDNKNHELVKELLMQSVQYLSVKEDKRKFRTRSNKKLYKENEAVYFESQLFNDNYESINDPEVSLIITNENNENFDYTLSRTNNYYTLSVSGMNAGKYRFEAKTNLNGEPLTDKGSFTIQSIDLESYDLTARHGILKQLSEQSSGKLFFPSQIIQLKNLLTQEQKLKPILYQSTKTNSLLNYWWILGIAILLLAIEWFIRRFIGSY